MHNTKEAVLLILRKRPELNRFDQLGATPLVYACEKQSYETVQAFLQAGSDPRVMVKTSLRNTLMIVLLSQREELVDLFLPHCDIRYICPVDGKTALALAVWRCTLPTIKKLIALGADPTYTFDIKSRKGTHIIDMAAQYQPLEVLKYFMTMVPKSHLDDILFWSLANAENPEVFQYLISQPEFKNKIDNVNSIQGETPLLVACNHANNEANTLTLLALKPKVNIINNDGCSALIFACQASTYKVIESLINMGARVDVKSKTGLTPIAALGARNTTKDDIRIAKLLIRHGANLTYRSSAGYDLFTYLRKLKHTQLAQYLKSPNQVTLTSIFGSHANIKGADVKKARASAKKSLTKGMKSLTSMKFN